MKYIICADCGGHKSNSKTSNYCRPCGYKYRTRPTGLKYNLVKENPTTFKKGMTPWNAGTVGVMKAWNKGIKGSVKPNSGSFTTDKTIGELNINWKGNDVGYFALHAWVNRKLGKAKTCEYCGTNNSRVEWANKSHQYKRTTNDWIQLCKKCHYEYDKQNWGIASEKYPEIKVK